MNEVFSDLELKSRMDAYFAMLDQAPNIRTIQNLYEQMKSERPNDGSVNYLRVQRDIKKFFDDKKITYTNPIEELRAWAKKHYMYPNEQDFFCSYSIDILFDYPNVYFKTKPYDAEKIGQHIREKYGHLCPFVIADYDTVLIRFKKQEKFIQFKDIFETYLDVIPEDED